MNLVITCLCSLIISLLSAKLVIYLLGKNMLDLPNQRSSHSIPTPRGGGIAIYIGLVCGLLILEHSHDINQYRNLLFIGPLSVIFTLGLMDDLFSLRASTRLIVQTGAAITASLYILPSEQITSPSIFITLGFGILFIVWMTNLYNFMDGINGLAALEGIFVCFSIGLILWLSQPTTNDSAPLIILGFSIAGFLYWNFPKAKLFMGDSGSPVIGFFLALVALKSLTTAPEVFISWLIIFGVFIVDASLTLIVRIKRKQKFYEAHRTHAYQKASDLFESHSKTSLLILAINIIWIFPLALLVALGKIHPLIGLLVAYTPLIIAHTKLRGGI